MPPAMASSITVAKAAPSVENMVRAMICKVSRLMSRATSIGAGAWSQWSRKARASSTMAGA